MCSWVKHWCVKYNAYLAVIWGSIGSNIPWKCDDKHKAESTINDLTQQMCVIGLRSIHDLKSWHDNGQCLAGLKINWDLHALDFFRCSKLYKDKLAASRGIERIVSLTFCHFPWKAIIFRLLLSTEFKKLSQNAFI